MTVKNIIPATPSNRKQWKGNQCVTIGCKQNQLLVTSRQNRSTPGIYTEVYLKQNTCYCVEISGQALGNSRAFVFVYNPVTKKRLIPNYTFLPSTCFGCVEASFVTPSCGNDYLCIYIGVLLTAPCNGQQFCLQEARIHVQSSAHKPVCAEQQTAQCPVNPYVCQPTHAPKQAIEPCSTKYNAVYKPRCDDSSTSDDSCEYIERHHHHHYGSSGDPYYTYQTHPHQPTPVVTSKKVVHPAPPCQPTTCPPSSLKAQQCPVVKDPPCPSLNTSHHPVTISDLQSSLSTMISQLK